MEEEVEYGGRTTVVHTEEVGRGGWTWWFFIEGRGLRRGTDRPLPDESMALREGIQEAEQILRSLGGQ
jgi:hypothetical protein